MTVFLILLKKYWLHVLIAAAVIGALLWVYDAGKESKQKDWDAAVARGIIEAEKLKKKQVIVTTKIETVYVEKVRTVYEKGETIVKQVPVYVPADAPDLPGSLRVFHDAAAGNFLPDASRIPDASPVELATFAGTVASNYTVCHVNSVRLEGLQTWVREQQGLNP
jgi:hypothetical protein